MRIKINNSTHEDLIISYGNKESICKANGSVCIITETNEIHVKSAESEPIINHFKIFKHQGNDSVKGKVTYFNPGFHYSYASKISFNPELKEISITKFDMTLHSLLVFRVYISKEAADNEIFFTDSKTKTLLRMFITLTTVPGCVITGFLTLIAIVGIISEFDWLLVAGTVVLVLLFWAFSGLSKITFRALKPDKFYSKILGDIKTVCIYKQQKHYLSFNETDYIAEEYSLNNH